MPDACPLVCRIQIIIYRIVTHSCPHHWRREEPKRTDIQSVDAGVLRGLANVRIGFYERFSGQMKLRHSCVGFMLTAISLLLSARMHACYLAEVYCTSPSNALAWQAWWKRFGKYQLSYKFRYSVQQEKHKIQHSISGLAWCSNHFHASWLSFSHTPLKATSVRIVNVRTHYSRHVLAVTSSEASYGPGGDRRPLTSSINFTPHSFFVTFDSM